MSLFSTKSRKIEVGSRTRAYAYAFPGSWCDTRDRDRRKIERMNRFLKMNGAIWLLAVASIAGSCGIAHAQKTEAKTPPAYVFPKTVSLAMRGKAGDSYKFKSTFTSSTKMSVEGQAADFSSEDKSEKTYSWRLLDSKPDGNLSLELKLIEGIETNRAEDGIRRKSMKPGTLLALLKPNLEQVKLSFPKAIPTEKATVKPSEDRAEEPDNEQKKILNELLSSIAYPSKTLTPGDTWTVKAIDSQYSPNPIFKDLELKGKLLEFAMFKGVPCSKVQISLDYQGASAEVMNNLKQSLPENAVLKGETTFKIKTLYYISLDRNAILDKSAKAVITLDYLMTLDGKKSKIGGDITFEGQETATLFPTFDPEMAK